MKVLPWKWLKWRGKSVPKECSKIEVYAEVVDEDLEPVDTVVETRAGNCSELFSNH